MMKVIPKAVLAALACQLAFGSIHVLAEEEAKDPEITVRVGKSAWTYTHKQLLDMTTTTIPNLKGTRQKPAIPLEAILFKDTGLSAEKLDSVTVLTKKGMPTVLKGADLAYINKLVLASGDDKGGYGHPWAMAAEDEATYTALRPRMGSRRKHVVVRIDIVPEAAPSD